MVLLRTGSVFSNILKNAGKLLFGTVCAGILGLFYTLLAARTLSPAGLGEVALIFAWPRLIATIFTCRSWQVILHYGAIPLQKGDRQSVQRSFSFALGLDFLTGGTSLIVGLLGVLFFSHWLGVQDAALFYLALAGCLVIPGRCLNSAATGILRLFDQMGMVAREEPYMAIIRLLLGVIAWKMGWGVKGFVFAYGFSMMFGQAYLLWAAFKVLKQAGFEFKPCISLLKLSQEMPKGVWELVWSSNLSHSIISGMMPSLCLVIGMFFGPATVAFFTLADSFINAVGQPADLLERSYYPELTRLDIRKPAIWRLLFKVEILSILFACTGIAIVWIGGKPLFSFFGPDYIAALPILTFMAPTLLFWLTAMPLEGILYCAGRSKSALGLQVNYVFVMFCFMSVAFYEHSVSGLGLAYTLANGVNIIVYLSLVAGIFFRRKEITPLHERLS